MHFPSLRANVALLGLLLITGAATAGMTNAPKTDVLCGITKSASRGMLTLEGSITSPTSLDGEYRFAIRSSSNGGSSNISQGGYFNAKANEATALGKVMINDGSNYTIDFKVTSGGQNLDCSQELTTIL